MNPDGENRLLPSKLTMTIRKGEVFRHVLAGAGGWGDPLERDPAAVLRDEERASVAPEGARRLWRGGGHCGLDGRRRRNGAPARGNPSARGWTETPKVQWHEPELPRRAAE